MSARQAIAAGVLSIQVFVVFAAALLCFSCDSGSSTRPLVRDTPAAVDTIPPSWGGVWVIRAMARACGTTLVLADTTVVDTLCPGEPVTGIFGLGIGLFCPGVTVQVDGPDGTYTCTQSFTAACPGTLTVDASATFDPTAGIMNGSGRVTFSTAPGTGACVDSCVDITLIGVRTRSALVSCP